MTGHIRYPRDMKNTGTSKVLLQVKNFDVAMRRQIRVAALMEGRSMAEWIEEACRKQLTDAKKKSKE